MYCILHLFQVNYSPYFFDLHLKYEINDCKTRVVIADSKITFHLVKLEPTLWETLVNPLAKDSTKRFVFWSLSDIIFLLSLSNGTKKASF